MGCDTACEDCGKQQTDATGEEQVDKKSAEVRSPGSQGTPAEAPSTQGAPPKGASAEVQSPGPNDPGHLLRGVSAAFMLGVENLFSDMA